MNLTPKRANNLLKFTALVLAIYSIAAILLGIIPETSILNPSDDNLFILKLAAPISIGIYMLIQAVGSKYDIKSEKVLREVKLIMNLCEEEHDKILIIKSMINNYEKEPSFTNRKRIEDELNITGNTGISKVKSVLEDFKENITYINNTVAMFVLESISEDVSQNMITSVISEVTPILTNMVRANSVCKINDEFLSTYKRRSLTETNEVQKVLKNYVNALNIK